MSAGLWPALAAAGALGALARFALDRTVSARSRGPFPIGILVVNVTGAFALGMLIGLSPGSAAILVLGTGFLGAYTTFSTWMVDSERLAGDGRSRLAVLNLLASAVAGLIAAGLGLLAGGALA